MKKKILLGLGLVFLFFYFNTPSARAAAFFFSPKAASLQIGQTFDLELKVNSENQGFNAAQGTIVFPKDILEVKSIDTSATSSVFNFWPERPNFSNSEGKVTFIGGTDSGVVGASVQVLKIFFKTKGGGEANVALSDAAITASDGSGTNILSTVENARFTVGPMTVAPGLQSPAPLVPEPTQITKTPEEAQQLPDKPKLSVPVYADPQKWYNITTNFLVQWNLPADISGVNTTLNKEPDYTPTAKSEGLFDSKIFPALTDGVWYLHERFKNSLGWGPAAHYRLAIDTVPPLPFNIEVAEGIQTDNPAPTIQFKTSDGLSGIARYEIRTDSLDPVTVEAEEIKLPVLEPGSHSVLVQAMDLAGNIRENNLRFTILPIASPSITTITKDVFIGEGDITVVGTASTSGQILLTLKDKTGTILSQTMANVDKNGNWQSKFIGPFKKGQYIIEATAQDERGAKSLVVQSETIKVREKPVLTLGSLEITQLWFLLGLFLILLGGFAIGWFSYRLWRRQLERKVQIAERDVINTFAIIDGDIDKILKNYLSGKIDERKAEEMEFTLKKIKEGLKKTQGYIVENIKEIDE